MRTGVDFNLSSLYWDWFTHKIPGHMYIENESWGRLFTFTSILIMGWTHAKYNLVIREEINTGSATSLYCFGTNELIPYILCILGG